MEISLNPYCLDPGSLPTTPRATKVEREPEEQTEPSVVRRVTPREYDQLVADAWRINEAGYPRLAEAAMAEAGIRLHIDGDGR